MALTTYSELQAGISTWLARADLGVYIPDFIALFEAHANRNLLVRQMETSTTLTPASGSATLPTDYVLWRRVTWTGSPRRELEYVAPSYLQAAFPDTPAGYPSIFTIEGSTLKIRPTDTTDLEFNYYQKIPAVSGSVNWLFSSHPDLYLFGSLAEAGDFLDDEKKLMKWKARRDELMAEVERVGNRSGSSAIRIMGVTP